MEQLPYSTLVPGEVAHWIIVIYSSKKVLHHSLLFLCILKFPYLWNLEKWSDQAQIFRECFLNPLLLLLKRTGNFERWNYFCSKTTFWAQKCKITIIMCSNNVFFIIMWDLIKIDSKLQKLQPFSSIYPNEKLVQFSKLWLLPNVFRYPHLLNPSIVVTRKLKMMHVLSLVRSAVITKEFYQ